MVSGCNSFFLFRPPFLPDFFLTLWVKSDTIIRTGNRRGGGGMRVLVKAIWDPEAAVWAAESEDVPGLVLGSGSFDALMERLRHAIPEMLALNGTKADSLQLRFVSERLEQAAI